MHFSSPEVRDLVKAWAAISLAIAVAILGVEQLSILGLPILIRAFAIYSLTVGVAFLAHEVLGHKFLAQRYRLFAEFRADDLFLLLAVLLSFTGFVFAAPGAVVIGGVTRVDTYGKIAAAGPLVNILLALGFGFLSRAGIALALPLYDVYSIDLIGSAYQINAWLALFNLLPLGVLDGAKVLAWNWKVWFVLIAISAVLFFGVV
uniref:Site-2 protease family protein n=1 Tax=candidate division WWE3 bacterium TaxID=2053526 RepID=A0A832DS27_UNCKA